MGSVPPTPVELLLHPAGLALLDQLSSIELTPDTALALGQRLRREHPADLVAAALTQHELRLRALSKFDKAMQMLFTRTGLEQATAGPVARHRAARLAPSGRVADLCTGIGGDLLALAGGHAVLAVDRDPTHLRLAMHNCGVYGAHGPVEPVVADVRDIALSTVEAVFVDPARRDGSARMRAGDCEPPLAWCFGLAATVARVCVKAAPGLARELVPPGWELEFVADGRELKEATLWSPALATTTRRATILPDRHTLTWTDAAPVAVKAPGEFLYDPNPAVTRAGLVAQLAHSIDAWQIDPLIGFICTDSERHTPFARTLQVAASLPWSVRRLAGVLRELDVGAIDIRRRGLAGDVEVLRARFKLRGSRRATVVMTRVDNQPWALVCFPSPDPLLPLPAAPSFPPIMSYGS